jgi:hypothetical protein
MAPKSVRGIGEAAGSEGVGNKEVAELVVDSWLRRREPRQKKEAQEDRGEEEADKPSSGMGG